ncbi:MAG TPA: 23S rRNA (adenine(2030)-N(6))-methyltransferase RlmJ [Rhizomicrobium sp.]|nr:23S rRNA (adenine(2030)-N(6))-methyltransferase RlmJ [Rhizomicrobium sp.]
MNYRHAFHAGNFADVMKHLALVAVLLHLRRKEKPFCAIDTHAGAGLYDLTGPEAARSREAESGIARIRDLARRADVPDALRAWLECVKDEGEGSYPGSPRLMARLLRPQDRLIAIEKHPQEAAALRNALGAFPRARAIEGDGYAQLLPLLPPRERRGVVLIDPPYEAKDEFLRATDLLACAHRRFATGTYLLWFPVKASVNAEALGGELRTQGIAPAVRLDIDLNVGKKESGARLSSAGLVIVNPPYSFEAEMTAAAEFLAPRLSRDGVSAAISLASL